MGKRKKWEKNAQPESERHVEADKVVETASHTDVHTESVRGSRVVKSVVLVFNTLCRADSYSYRC